MRPVQVGLKLWWAIVAVCSCVAFAAPSTPADNEEVYFAAEVPFSESNWEIALQPGYVFSDPYLNIFSTTVGAYYLFDRVFAVGIEGTGYASWKSNAAKGQDAALGPFRLLEPMITPFVRALAASLPSASAPVSGMVNLFSSSVIMGDIFVLARGGTIKLHGIFGYMAPSLVPGSWCN